MSEINYITKEDTIGDILYKLPAAQEILLSYGLGCVGCSVSTYESLEDGVFGHGFTENDLSEILEDLNIAWKEEKNNIYKSDTQKIELTDNAYYKIQEFQKEQNKDGYGFKIEVLDTFDTPSYFLDFLQNPESHDQIIEVKEIKIFIDLASLKFLKNKVIDFVKTNEGEGFKIDQK